MNATRMLIAHTCLAVGLLLALGMAAPASGAVSGGAARATPILFEPYRYPPELAGGPPLRQIGAGQLPPAVGVPRLANSSQPAPRAGSGTGWQKVMVEDFETAFPAPGWRVSDNSGGQYAWGRRNCRVHSDVFSAWAGGGGSAGASLVCGATYPDGLTTLLRYGPVDLMQVDDAEFQFGLWADIEGDGPNLIDSFWWAASTDGQNYAGHNTAGQTIDWVPYTMSLSDVPNLGNLIGRSGVYLALAFFSDGSNPLPYKGAFADDLALWMYTATQPEPEPLPITLPITRHTTLADFAGGRSYDGAVMTTAQGDGALALARQASGVGAWERLPSLPSELVNLQAVAAKDHLFVLGGNRPDAGFQRAVYSARIGDAGVLDRWRPTTPLPQALTGLAAVVAGDYLFVLGGYNANGRQATVFSAPIKSDGTLGAWTSQASLPQPLINHAAVAANGYLYVLGGELSDEPAVVSDKIYRAKIDSNGSVGSWETLPGSLPMPTQWHASVAACNHLYLIAGADTTYERNAVFEADLRADGSLGAWRESAHHLPKTLVIHTAAALHGGVLVAGGWNSGEAPVYVQRGVYWAPFGADCTLGEWAEQPALPYASIDAALAATDRYIYYTGGIIPPIRASAGVFVAPLQDAGSSARQGRFDHQFQLGGNYAIKTLGWIEEGSGDTTVSVRYRVARAGGAYGPWSDYTTANPVRVNAFGGHLEYELKFVSGGASDKRVDEVHIGIAPNTPPTLANLPARSLPVNMRLDRTIDLWDYAGDAEFTVDALTFAIDSTSDPHAGASIDSNRYVTIAPAAGWTGTANVVVRVTDPGGLSATSRFLVLVTGGSKVYLPVVMYKRCPLAPTQICLDDPLDSTAASSLALVEMSDQRDGR